MFSLFEQYIVETMHFNNGPTFQNTGGIFNSLCYMSTFLKMATFGPRIAHVASEILEKLKYWLKTGYFRLFRADFAEILQISSLRLFLCFFTFFCLSEQERSHYFALACCRPKNYRPSERASAFWCCD